MTSRSRLPPAQLLRRLDDRRDERRDGQQGEAQRRQARDAVGRRLLELAHRGVQRRGAPQQVEADPADVEDDLAVIGAVQGHDAVGEVGDQQRDDRRGQQVEGRQALARVDGQADGGGQQEDVAQRIGDRHQLARHRHRLVVQVGRDERDPRQQRQAQRHDQRVDDARAIALRVAPADEHQQARHQRRVDGHVGAVAQRRERDVGAEQPRVAVGVEVAEPEQRHPDREPGPRPARGRLVAADTHDDRHDGREAEEVEDRAAGRERRHPHVERRTAARRRPGRAATCQSAPGDPAAHGQAAASSQGSAPRAGWSSPRWASSSSAAISMSISASVLAAVTWTRKPTSSLGTSG